MNNNMFNRAEVVLVATCFYEKEDKSVKLYLFNN